MTGEELALARQVGHSHVVAGNQIAHDLTQVGVMVFCFRHGVAARQTQFGQLSAQGRQRLFVQKPAQVVGAEKVNLGLADAAEQCVVLFAHLLHRHGAGRGHQLGPAGLQQGTGGRRLGHRQSQALEQSRRRCCIKKRRQNAVDFSAGGFFVQSGRNKNGGLHRVLPFSAVGPP